MLTIEILNRIQKLTEEQLELPGENSSTICAGAVEELGELSRAIRIEDDAITKRHKLLDEPSTFEALDLTICALSVYFARGGKLEDIDLIMNSKIDKWVGNVKRNINDVSK